MDPTLTVILSFGVAIACLLYVVRAAWRGGAEIRTGRRCPNCGCDEVRCLAPGLFRCLVCRGLWRAEPNLRPA